MEEKAIQTEGGKGKETAILQRSITRNCELWYLLHQMPCGFIALGQCFEKGGKLLTTQKREQLREKKEERGGELREIIKREGGGKK